MSEQRGKGFPLTLAGMWASRSGKTISGAALDSRGFDALQKALSQVTLGGKIVLEENRNKKNPKGPTHYLIYLTPEQVAERDAEIKAFIESQKGGSPQSRGDSL